MLSDVGLKYCITSHNVHYLLREHTKTREVSTWITSIFKQLNTLI